MKSALERFPFVRNGYAARFGQNLLIFITGFFDKMDSSLRKCGRANLIALKKYETVSVSNRYCKSTTIGRPDVFVIANLIPHLHKISTVNSTKVRRNMLFLKRRRPIYY